MFGPGQLAEFLWIYVPAYLPDYPSDLSLDLGEYDRSMHKGDESLAKSYLQGELLRLLRYFARSFMGDTFAWDPAEVRGGVTPEYAIYALPLVGYTVIKIA